MKNKRRDGAQPEMKSLFRGHGGFPIKQKGEAVCLSFALERHLWRPRGIACYNCESPLRQRICSEVLYRLQLRFSYCARL